jgi:SSS family solute:Na+ symporter
MIMASVNLAAIKIAAVLIGLDKYTTVLICSGITALYAASSGLRGVVLTDVVQFGIAMAGAFAAAYYAVIQPEVGGLAGLFSHPNVVPKLSLLPDFSNWDVALAAFIIPVSVQWWSTWYPGSEPGGGGYVAQRMLAARNEKESMLTTLLFNILHYGLRPWPWIIVALASMIIYPDIASIQARFPHLDPSIVRNDLAYPAMLVYLPHGMLGIMVASLAAAYMSTVSTQLNWGASYLVDDFYRRFLRGDKPDRHYVTAARFMTVFLVAVAAVLSLWLENAYQAFQIMLQVGAGTGLIYLLRWFWWRVNAWSEISGMVFSFLVAIYFQIIHTRLGFAPMPATTSLVLGVLITTVGWLVVTFLTPPTETATLQAYYDRIHPMGRWDKVVRVDHAARENVTAAFLCWFLGCVVVYSALFGTGAILYGHTTMGVIYAVVALSAGAWLIKLLPRVGVSE